eukprot:COSAG02_NODE_66326_length_255_cov_1.653846_1_plen_43_part_10
MRTCESVTWASSMRSRRCGVGRAVVDHNCLARIGVARYTKYTV